MPVPVDRPPEAAKCGRCHAKPFQGAPVELDAVRPQKHVANSDVPVIVGLLGALVRTVPCHGASLRSSCQEPEAERSVCKSQRGREPRGGPPIRRPGNSGPFRLQWRQVAARQAGVTDGNILHGWVE
jgi:thioredoxin 2